MVNVTINKQKIQVEEGTTILEAAHKVGLSIPTLCYLKGINEISSCRVCMVKVVGVERLVTACDHMCTEGMEIRTNTPQVREARRTNLELLMSQHRINCPHCWRNSSCQLKELVSSFSIHDTLPFRIEYSDDDWDRTLPIIRNESKCIRCWRCVAICEKVQELNIWDMVGTGGTTRVGISFHRKLEDSDCVFCGQCVTHCPGDALGNRDDVDEITGMNGVLNDPSKVTVVQVAPAVRAAWDESFNLGPEIATERRLAAVLRRIGFDYVFDTNFGADLTIMEEATEFLERMQNPEGKKWPMFTSCCPGWVRFVKSQYPDMVDQLSTSKSPQQMFGAITKTYFAEKIGVDPKDIVCISIMPCTAKKAELAIPSINDAAEGVLDVDFSLTTREMNRMIKADQLDVASVPEEDFDSPLGTGTGAAVIFGSTGGVMEAALRTCYYIMTGENPNADETFKAVRAQESDKPWVEAEYNVAGTTVRTAVVNGLGNARKLVRAVRRGRVKYDFVEVMACPGGCVGGGGQPIQFNENRNLARKRAKVLYDYDKGNVMRCSHENPEIQTLYAEYLGKPCGELAHHLLHTDHSAWDVPKTPTPDEDVVLR